MPVSHFPTLSDSEMRDCIAHVVEQAKTQEGILKTFYDDVLLFTVFDYCQRRGVDFISFMERVQAMPKPKQ